jgi:hypothetical protein
LRLLGRGELKEVLALDETATLERVRFGPAVSERSGCQRGRQAYGGGCFNFLLR